MKSKQEEDGDKQATATTCKVGGLTGKGAASKVLLAVL